MPNIYFAKENISLGGKGSGCIKGTKRSDIIWKHMTIYLTEEQDNLICYNAVSSGKTVSAYITDLVFDYGNNIPSKVERYGVSANKKKKSLCMPQDKLQLFKARAGLCNMSLSGYIVSVILEVVTK